MTATESCAKLTVVKAATRCNARVAALLFAALLFERAAKKNPGVGDRGFSKLDGRVAQPPAPLNST
jgi:hypothetical protein